MVVFSNCHRLSNCHVWLLCERRINRFYSKTSTTHSHTKLCIKSLRYCNTIPMQSEKTRPIFVQHRDDHVENDFADILLRGPLAAMRDFVPAHSCKTAVLTLVQNTLLGIADELNRVSGTQLLEDSRAMALKHEKSWFLITINVDDWLESIGTLELKARVALSVSAWQFEEIPQLLDMLHGMNPDTEYMLSMEIFDVTGGQSFYYAGVVLRPEDKVTTPLPPGYKLRTHYFYNECKRFMNRICPVCQLASNTLKKCGSCRVRYYCSRECQTNDWKLHRNLCTRLKGLREQNELQSLD